MMTKKTLTIIVLLAFGLISTDMGLWANTAGILPGANVQQEKTEKKEEEKKEEKKDKKVKRVWTDKDLKEIRKKRLNITEVSPEPKDKKKKKGASTAPAPVRNTTVKKKFDPKKTEQYWRKRKQELVDRINASEKEIERLEKKLLQLNLKRGGDGTYMDLAQLEQQIRETHNKLQSYKSGLESLKKQLEDLPDELRKAGGLPGWIRD
jgi:chromosome segregation ATPase